MQVMRMTSPDQQKTSRKRPDAYKLLASQMQDKSRTARPDVYKQLASQVQDKSITAKNYLEKTRCL